MQTNRVAPLALSVIDPTTIAINTWSPFRIGGVAVDGLIAPVFMIRVTVRCDSTVFLSFNGVDRHDTFLGWTSRVVYFQTNSSVSGDVSKVKIGTKFYIQGDPDWKGGNIFLSGYYNELY